METDAQASAVLLTEVSASAENFKQRIAALSLERERLGLEQRRYLQSA